MSDPQQFASDNYSGPSVRRHGSPWPRQNQGPRTGLWRWTHGRPRRRTAFRALFETNCEVFFAFNGTAANSLALAALCQSYHGCDLFRDRAMSRPMSCGAPEFFLQRIQNCMVAAIGRTEKLTPRCDPAPSPPTEKDIHFPKPRVVTITQADRDRTGLWPRRTGAPFSRGPAGEHRSQSPHGRRAFCQRLFPALGCSPGPT